MGRLLAVLIVALAAGCEVQSPPLGACKPEAPIDLEANLVGDPAAPFGIVARASSRTGHEVELEIVLPDGVAHLGGERRTLGRRCLLQVDARHAVAERCDILVRATIRDGKSRLSRVVSLAVPGAPPAPAGTLGTDSRGQAILEFRP